MKQTLIKSSFLAVALSSLLSGCALMGFSEVEYECKIGEEEKNPEKCASVEKSYKAAKSSVDKEGHSVYTGPKALGKKGQLTEKQLIEQRLKESKGPYAVRLNPPDEVHPATPEFKPGSVNKVWRAPYVDKNGVKHGGEYIYFNTPGTWSHANEYKEKKTETFEPELPKGYEDKMNAQKIGKTEETSEQEEATKRIEKAKALGKSTAVPGVVGAGEEDKVEVPTVTQPLTTLNGPKL